MAPDLADKFWGILGGAFLLCYGIFGSLRPDVVLRGIAAAHPKSDFDEDHPILQLWTRGIAIAVGVMGLGIILRTLM